LKVLEFEDYSHIPELGGASVKGTVDPGEVGWYRSDRLNAGVEVECEGRRGDAVTSKYAYLSLTEVGDHQPTDFLCLWATQKEHRDWDRVHPNAVAARVLGFVQLDSMFGPWIRVR
jgi:hypothetical protein